MNIYRSLTSCVGICYASGVHAESGFGIILIQVVPRPFFCGYVLTSSICSTAVRLLSILLRAYMHTCLPACGHAGLDVCGFASLRVNLFFVAVIGEEQRVPLVTREAGERVGKYGETGVFQS